MAQATVLAFVGILLALSGYYLGVWWLEENEEHALTLAPSRSLANPSSSQRASPRGQCKDTGPQEFSTSTGWFLQCLAIALLTCITVSVNAWIFVREKRKEREEEKQRHLEKMEDRRRNAEEMMQFWREKEDQEINERLIWLPDGTVAAERRMRITNYRHHIGQQREDELRRFLAEKRGAIIQHIQDLRAIADAVNKFHKGASIANLTGATASAAGGIISIVGLALIPVTLGASVILSAVGAGIAVAGGVTKITAGVAEAKSNSTDRNYVERILRSCAEDLEAVCKEMDDYVQYILTHVDDESRERLLTELEVIRLEFFNLGAMGTNNLETDAFQIIKDFVKSLIMLITSLLDDIIRAAAAGAAKAGAQAAAGAAAKATGILGAIFLPLDIFDIVKKSIHIHKGAQSDMASRIREIADRMESIIPQHPQGNALPGTERRN